MPTPPANAISSSFQIGTYNPLTDTFTQALDLNDGTTFRIHNKALKLPQPDKTIIESGNVRTAGVVVPRWQYKARHIQVEVSLRGASTSAILNSIRSLLSAIETPPYTIRLALPGATLYSYADVLAVKHDIPTDTQQLLAGAITRIHMDFECRVGLRGDRVTLQNLAVNPGFEQPSGAGVNVFNDTFANVNAYTLAGGSAPTVAANVMTIPNGTQINFGSPGWGAINLWQVRFQWFTGGSYVFYLHFVNGNNALRVDINATSQSLNHVIAGTLHTLASAAQTLANANFYWLQITQFPAAPGEVADVQAKLLGDSAGAPGAVLQTMGPVPTFDAVTALSGTPAIFASGAACKVGGAFSNVHTVSLFGPGGWSFSPTSGTTGVCSGAWDQQTMGGSPNPTTYPNGPVFSFGAARIDLAPAGTVTAGWTHYGGGSPTGTFAIPTPSGGTVGASMAVLSSGLHATHASVALLINEYDISGSFLRQDTIQSALGGTTNGVWTVLSGSVALGVSCAYIALLAQVTDTAVAGESANGVVRLDNAQCWNQTTTGQTTMPWCDLRAARSPAQLVVNGLLGDMPAPAYLAVGTFVSSWPTSGTLTLYAGRKQNTNPTAQLVGPSYGAYSALFTPQATAALDTGSYAGYYPIVTIGNGSGWNPRFTSPTAYDAAGVYHLLARVRSAEAVGNLPNVSFRVATAQQTDAWFNLPSGADIVGQWTGPYVYPLTASNTWTIIDAGQCNLPPFPQGALTNPGALFLLPRAQWQDLTTGTAAANTDWQMLLPIDGILLIATLNNPSNSSGAVTNSWVWTYADPLLLNRAAPGDTAAWTTSIETIAAPNPGNGAGGAGTQSSGAINVNSAGDPFLVLDPDQGGSGATGVNQIVAVLADQAGAVYPLFGEIQYSPLYLYPR